MKSMDKILEEQAKRLGLGDSKVGPEIMRAMVQGRRARRVQQVKDGRR